MFPNPAGSRAHPTDMSTTFITKKTLGLETVEPAVTPPPADATNATFAKKPKVTSGRSRKKDIPEGLWTKCPKCSTMVFDKELDANLKVCPKCGNHFPIIARERIHSLVETCSFSELDADMTSIDVLEFTGVASYRDKLDAIKNRPSSRTPSLRALG